MTMSVPTSDLSILISRKKRWLWEWQVTSTTPNEETEATENEEDFTIRVVRRYANTRVGALLAAKRWIRGELKRRKKLRRKAKLHEKPIYIAEEDTILYTANDLLSLPVFISRVFSAKSRKS